MKTEVFTFKVIITKDIEDNIYVAHCLELDLVATSDKSDQLIINISDIIICQLQYCLENDNLEHFYKPAPLSDWKTFFNCKNRQIDTYIYSKQPFEIDNITFTPEIRLEKCFAE